MPERGSNPGVNIFFAVKQTRSRNEFNILSLGGEKAPNYVKLGGKIAKSLASNASLHTYPSFPISKSQSGNSVEFSRTNIVIAPAASYHSNVQIWN